MLSEATPITIGLVITLIGFVVSGIYWAATIRADVSHIRSDLNKIVVDHETRIRELEKGQSK